MYDALNLDIFTKSDEILYIILLENNAKDYAKMCDKKRNMSRKEARQK